MHIYIFFFQQVRQIKSQTFNRCIVDIVLLVCFVIIFNSLSRIRGEFFDMSPFIMVVCTMSRKSVTQTKFCCRPPRKKKKSRGRENSKNQMQSEQPIFFPSVVPSIHSFMLLFQLFFIISEETCQVFIFKSQNTILCHIFVYLCNPLVQHCCHRNSRISFNFLPD